MNKYQKQIDDLDSEVYVNMGNHSQIVIDLVEDATGLEEDELGSFCYSLSKLQEVFDPKKILDISILERLGEIVRAWLKEVELCKK